MGEAQVSSVPAAGRLARAGAFLGLLILVLAYLLFGLLGRDPWGPDEGRATGIVHSMAASGDLVVPALAGAPVLETPPGYYLGAVGMVRLLGDRLAMHDAARVTTGVCVMLALLFTGLTAWRAWGVGIGRVAVLTLLGSVGLIYYGHVMVADLGLLAGMAMGGYGLLRARESVVWGGLWLGTGCGLAFLSTGPFGPAALGLAALLLFAFSDWRKGVYPRALVIALVVALPWLAIWPAELYLRDPELYRAWLAANDPLGHLQAAASAAPPQGEFWLRTLPWVSFPVLPLALWTLIRHPGLALGNPGVRVGLAVSLAGWGLLLWSTTARDLQALPMLVPLAVIAAGGLRDLPGWVVAVGYWLSLIGWGMVALALWSLWGYGLVHGGPPPWVPVLRDLPLDIHGALHPNAVLLALALTLVWVLAVKRLQPPRVAALAAWPIGLTLSLGLAGLLHLSWMDKAESYRTLFQDVQAHLPDGAGCVSVPRRAGAPGQPEAWTSLGLSSAQLALLTYFTDIRAAAPDGPGGAGCGWALTRLGRDPRPDALALEQALGPGWEWVWEGRRPVDRQDRFLLLRAPQQPAGGLVPSASPDHQVAPLDAGTAPDGEGGAEPLDGAGTVPAQPLEPPTPEASQTDG